VPWRMTLVTVTCGFVAELLEDGRQVDLLGLAPRGFGVRVVGRGCRGEVLCVHDGEQLVGEVCLTEREVEDGERVVARVDTDGDAAATRDGRDGSVDDDGAGGVPDEGD
jgi:hypothetical protein